MADTSKVKTTAEPAPLVYLEHTESGVRVLSEFTLWWGDDGWEVYDGQWKADIKAHDAYVLYSSPQEQAQIDSVLASVTDIMTSLPHDGARLVLRPENTQTAELRIEREDHYV